MGEWADEAARVIRQVHASLPATATYEERRKALSQAYPFGQRAYSPYKTWLRHCRLYLAQFSHPRKMPLSPLERMMAKSKEPTP